MYSLNSARGKQISYGVRRNLRTSETLGVPPIVPVWLEDFLSVEELNRIMLAERQREVEECHARQS